MHFHIPGIVPVPAAGIAVAMDLVSGWCCGSPCDSEQEMKGCEPAYFFVFFPLSREYVALFV